MRSLAVDGYTAAETLAELTRSGRTVGFRYELVDAAGEILGDLDTVTGGKVENNALAQIKRTAKITLRDEGDVDYASDRIRPYYRLRMPDGGWAEWPLGLFLLSSPKRVVGGVANLREVEAYDQGLILAEDRTVDRYVIDAGTAYTTAVTDLLDGAGIPNRYVTASDATLPAARDWPAGTPIREIVNALLSSINYGSLTFDAEGFAVAKPYQAPADRPSEQTYETGSTSVLVPELEIDFDLFDVANRWIATTSDPDRDPIRSTYTNENPSSPTSTVSRGRTIVDHREVDASSQASLDALVARIAFEASQVIEAVDFDTATMPHHADNDVITIEYPDAGLSARYTEHTWELPLKVGAVMSHRIRRIVAV